MNEEKRIITPLNSTFMLSSIIGFLLSAFYIPTLVFETAYAWAFAFGLVFFIMFIASLISMNGSDLGYMEHLQIDEKRRIRL